MLRRIKDGTSGVRKIDMFLQPWTYIKPIWYLVIKHHIQQIRGEDLDIFDLVGCKNIQSNNWMQLHSNAYGSYQWALKSGALL